MIIFAFTIFNMASSIFALLDDIAALMDDVAVTSKIATKQTAGILGDDLAVNAEKATGFLSSRELPVLWAITKGSFLNKLIIIPLIFVLNFFLPLAIPIILVLGGVYLAYEGVEKIVEFLFHRHDKKEDIIEELEKTENDSGDEKTKVKAAITTDFILSLEIVIIALSTVLNKPFTIQLVTVFIVSIIATVGVYGLVALIVRMDDLGYRLIRFSKGKKFFTAVGNILVKALPLIIRSFSVLGTIALILVSGGIFVHNIHQIHELFPTMPSLLLEVLTGLVVGLIAVVVVTFVKKAIARIKK